MANGIIRSLKFDIFEATRIRKEIGLKINNIKDLTNKMSLNISYFNALKNENMLIVKLNRLLYADLKLYYLTSQ